MEIFSLFFLIVSPLKCVIAQVVSRNIIYFIFKDLLAMLHEVESLESEGDSHVEEDTREPGR